MKNLKKLASVVLAAVMTLALMVPAFAAGDPDPATGYKITVTNPQPGSTYNFYKIFDMTNTGTNYSYTATEKWKSFFGQETIAENYITTEANEHPVVINGENKFLNLTDDNIVAFGKAARDYALNNKIVADATNSVTEAGAELTETFDNGGYYMVFATDATQEVTGQEAMCILTNTNSSKEITIKSTKPSIEKTTTDAELTEDSAQIGDEIPFTIKGTVPDTTGFESYTYIITDTMSTGLTYNEDAAVTINGVAATDGVTITKASNGDAFTFKVEIDVKKYTVGAPIVVTYTATVNENVATVYDPQTNKATLTYSDPSSANDDKTTTTTPENNEVTIYSSNIVIDKFKGDATNIDTKPVDATQLAGAKFNLYQTITVDGNDVNVYYSLSNGAVHWIAKDGEDWYEYTYDKETSTWTKADEASALTPTEVETDNQGAAQFSGLKNGTYYLEETAAPDGYNKLTEAKQVIVEATREAYDKDTDEKLTTNEDITAAKAVGKLVWKYSGKITSEVANLTGAELPETGGMGTTLFYAVGGLLVVGAGVLLIVKKRMGAE